MTLNFGSNLFPPRRDFNVSFDYRDTITGNAYVQYFGGAAYDDNNALTYILNTVRFDSASTLKTGRTSRYYTILGDNTTTTINFDTKVGVTTRLFGKLSTEFLLHAGNNDNLTTIKATLKRVDADSNVTTLLEIGETDWNVGITGETDNWKRINLSNELTDIKRLIKGDTLRLEIEITVTSTQVNKVWLYHDPNIRDSVQIGGNNEKTDIVLNLPFRLEE